MKLNILLFILLIIITYITTKKVRHFPQLVSSSGGIPPLTQPYTYFPRERFMTPSMLPGRVDFSQYSKKSNCFDVCNEKHSKVNCNLGIVPGESASGQYSFLTCSCISNQLIQDERTYANIHIHGDWCFDVYGCYRSIKGKCKELKN